MEERIRYYFILNFGPTEIANQLRQEFRELELTEFSRRNVDDYIKKHLVELTADANQHRLALRDRIDRELKENFTTAHLFETRIVRTYIKKGEEALTALEILDLTAQDEDGNFINRGQFITLMMIIKEQQQLIEKLSQTAAAREYSLYVKKMEAKEKMAKESGLLAADAEVSFLDDTGDGFMKDVTPK